MNHSGLVSCSHYPGGDVQICGSCVSREQWQLKPEKMGCGTTISPYGSRHAQGRRSNSRIRMAPPAVPGQPCAAQVLHVLPAKMKLLWSSCCRNCLLLLRIPIPLLSCPCSYFLLSKSRLSLICPHVREGERLGTNFFCQLPLETHGLKEEGV